MASNPGFDMPLSKSSTKPIVTISDWVLVQAQGQGLKRLLTHVAGLDTTDPAWISIATPELMQSQWADLDALWTRGDLLPLYGVPFAAKDNIDARGFQTTAACPDFAYSAEQDATVIGLLKSAGAILVGKTNLDQFATGLVGTRSPHGVVPNTFDKRYISGGSSSGSASVVARGLVPFALGTDTAGSGRVPAGLNNIIGLKPTRGALSARGVVPACRTLDCVSILSLTTEDAALVLQLTTSYDEKDAFSRPDPALFELQELPATPRVAVCKNPPWFGHTQQQAAYEQSILSCEEAGWDIVSTGFSLLFELADLLYEGPWVAERYAAIKDFITRPDIQMDPIVFGIINKARDFSSVDVFQAEYLRRDLIRKIKTQFYGFDAILVPTSPTFPTIQDVVDNPVIENSRLGMYTNFVNLADWSALAFPAGYRTDGLPFGLTLISSKWQERKLVNLSRQLSFGRQTVLGHTGTSHKENVTELHTLPTETLLAVVGAHLTELPLNYQLLDMGAILHSATTTASKYKFFKLNGPSTIRKPGLIRNENDTSKGFSIDVELWRVPTTEISKFARSIPSPLSLGPLELANGSWVTGFICDRIVPSDVKVDISEYGGWKKYLETSDGDDSELQQVSR